MFGGRLRRLRARPECSTSAELGDGTPTTADRRRRSVRRRAHARRSKDFKGVAAATVRFDDGALESRRAGDGGFAER